tara:strand:- start:96 stop:344 length:249 start_codon:yes stop_codon:yes gene_type:complete
LPALGNNPNLLLFDTYKVKKNLAGQINNHAGLTLPALGTYLLLFETYKVKKNLAGQNNNHAGLTLPALSIGHLSPSLRYLQG